MKTTFIIVLILTLYVTCSFACNGYTLKILKSKNCVDNSIIKLPEKNFSIVLDKDCNVYGTGCVDITKDFTTAKGTYVAQKPPIPQIEGDFDLCGLSTSLNKLPELMKAMEVMGIPSACPVKAKKICGSPENKFSLGKYKNQIGMGAGNSELRLEIEHDSGKSCIEIELSLSKPRKG